MDPGEVLITVILGMVLGMLGQAARFLVGATNRTPSFQKVPFLVGFLVAFLVGATAGGLGAVTFLGEELTTKEIFSLIGIGYVGTDFVEQLIKAKFPAARAT